MSNTKMLVIVFLILLIILYLQSYLKPDNEYTIIQTYLDKLKIDTLYEKHPIIIYDHIYDPYTLLKSLFAYSYTFHTSKNYTANQIYITKSKFTLLHNDSQNTTIHLVSPKYKLDTKKTMNEQSSDVQYVTVILKQNQILILPLFWQFECNQTCKSIDLDDCITPIIKYVF